MSFGRGVHAAAFLAVILGLLVVAASAGAAGLGFGPRQYVDEQLAGGEPLVFADNRHHTLIYTSHEGTTHLYRPGLVTPLDFAANYRNQVNIWRSDDNGTTWKRLNFAAGFQTDPTKNTGFSDPDLTQDTGGRVYDTGIDLVNDALFSTGDGGKNWDRGTVNCHNGDRPWLAGGRDGELFLATNTTEDGHRVFQSTDGGNSCSAAGIPDEGQTSDGGSYVGDGKLLYDSGRDQLVEPVVFENADGKMTGLGASTWTRGATAFKPGARIDTTMFAHWPAIAIDRGGTLYLVWDTDPRRTDGGGCGDTLTGNSASGSPLPNSIQLAYSRDQGKSWSAPITIAGGSNKRVIWPWVAAGDPGRVAVTWYETDRLADPDCQAVSMRIFSTHVSNATGGRSMKTVEASHGPIHSDSTVCQGGTTCVATGQDRRLGDFFTNALDPRGCELIASGDTTRPDPITGGPRPIALPIIIRQNSGSSLTGNGSC